MLDADHNQEPRWRRLPEERPRQIIDAALEVFGERGLAGARLEDIAHRAGVSKGTIYLYFPNKEALFCEMIRQMVSAGLVDTQARIFAASGSPTEQLRAYVRAVWEYLRSPIFEKVYRLMMGEIHNFPSLQQFYLEEVSQRSLRFAAEIVRRGIAAGEFRPQDPDVAARMLHALTVKHGIWCAQREQIPFLAHQTDDEVLAQLLDFYLHAILEPTHARAAGSHE
ncbi:MAG TPA: TetR/AcrR family transcriptional regulator [Gemmatimonadaceae bacterium]